MLSKIDTKLFRSFLLLLYFLFRVCFRFFGGFLSRFGFRFFGGFLFRFRFSLSGGCCRRFTLSLRDWWKNWKMITLNLTFVEWMTEFQWVARIATWQPWNEQVVSEVTSWNEMFSVLWKERKMLYDETNWNDYWMYFIMWWNYIVWACV